MLMPRTHRMRWTPDEPPAGAPAGEAPAATPPATPPAQQPAGQDPAAASQTPPPDGGKPEPKPTGDEEIDKLAKQIEEDPAKAAKEIKKLRKEAESRGEENRLLKEKQKQIDEAALAEQGKFKELAESRLKDVDDLKAAHAKDIIALKVQLRAARMNFNDPEDAAVDAVLSKVKVGKDGQLEGIDEALKAYAEAKPYLVKQPDAPSGPPKVAPTNPGGGPTLTATDLKKLRPEQIAAMKPEEVAAILRGQ